MSKNILRFIIFFFLMVETLIDIAMARNTTLLHSAVFVYYIDIFAVQSCESTKSKWQKKKKT